MTCRICGRKVVIKQQVNGPELHHLSEEVDGDHGAVEDDGSYALD